MTSRVGVLRSADGPGRRRRAARQARRRRAPRSSTSSRGRPRTCSRSASPSPTPPRCARRPAARTGARTSPSATTPGSSGHLDAVDGRRRHAPLELAATRHDAVRRRARAPPGSTPTRCCAQVRAALAEDLPGRRRHLASATIAADARGERRLRRPRGRAWSPGSASPRWSSTRSWATPSRSPTGCPTAPGSRAGDVVMRVAGPTRGLLTAERTALNYASHLSGVATATAALGRRARGHQRPGARHPQDAADLPRAAEVRRPLRRRRQPPVQPQRPGDGQGQPRGRRRGSGAGVRGGAGGVPRPPGRGRGHRPRPAARAARRRAAPRSCSTTWTPPTMAEAVRDHRPAAPRWRPPAGSPSSGPARSPRPASTSSRSAR